MSGLKTWSAAVALSLMGTAAYAAPAKPVIAWMPEQVPAGPVAVHWDMWWGENGDAWRLYANDAPICSAALTPNGQQGQSGECAATLTDGIYRLQVQLCRADVCTASNEQSLTVGQGGSSAAAGTPNKPVIAWMPASVDLSAAATMTLRWDMWWGVNGDHWKLYQNGVLRHESPLKFSASQEAQQGEAALHLTEPGAYTFVVELCNGSGGAERCAASPAASLQVTATTTGGGGNPPPPDDGGQTDDGNPPPPDDGDSGSTDLAGNTPYINTSGRIVGGYFVEWGVYGRNYHVADIPAYNLTHLLYAFLAICGDNPSALDGARAAIDRECQGKPVDSVTLVDRFAALEKSYPGDRWDDPVRGNFGQLAQLKATYPDLIILPSVGGWTLSDPFYDLAGDPARRAVFVASVVDFLKTYPFFDGVDIDWEYPGGGAHPGKGSIADRPAYTALMTELRQGLDQLSHETGRRYHLTAAVNVSPAKVAFVDYTVVNPQMDAIFAMTYDFYGAWDNVLGHQTGLYPAAPEAHPGFNVRDGVNNLIQAGVDPAKIAVGVAFYGRGWRGVSSDGANIWSGVGHGPVVGTWEPGVLDYRDIETNFLGGPGGTGIAGFTAGYDALAEAPYLWNAGTGELITYDSPRSVRAKGQYVQTQGLGGVFAWELDADNGQLLNAMHDGLGHSPKTP